MLKDRKEERHHSSSSQPQPLHQTSLSPPLSPAPNTTNPYACTHISDKPPLPPIHPCLLPPPFTSTCLHPSSTGLALPMCAAQPLYGDLQPKAPSSTRSSSRSSSSSSSFSSQEKTNILQAGFPVVTRLRSNHVPGPSTKLES